MECTTTTARSHATLIALLIAAVSGVFLASPAVAGYTPVPNIVLNARDPDTGEVLTAWKIGRTMKLYATLDEDRPVHGIEFTGVRSGANVYLDFGYTTAAQPRIASVERVEGAVGTTTYKATDKSYKPGVPDTVSNSLDIDFFDIAVLVNATADPNDDYVVKKLPASLQRTPRNPLAGANGPSGKPDNHIPLQLKLTGPTGKKLKLKLGSTTSGGTLSFKKSDGGDYPADGIEVTAGNNLDARLYGETASTALEDAVIKVTGDRTGDAKWGQTATVIWVPGEDMKFRGTNDQGNPFSPNSEAQLTGSVYPPEVGHLRSATDGSRIGNHEEIEMVPYPKVLIPNVSWDLARQISRAAWYNGAAPPSYNGPGGWNDDGPTAVNYDEDSTQQANKLSLYTVDVPGPGSNPLAHTDTYTYKGKWHEWAEVQIGGKWYICSDYIYWRSIMHLKSNAAGTRWIDKPGTVNEVVRGTIDGWANTWSEENPAPSVTSIAPNTGVQGNTVTVTNLAGTNFVANATIVLARAGEVDIPATDVEWQTATKYTCKFVLPATAAVGDWDVKVTNIDNPNTATKSNAFSITTVP